MVRIAAVLVLLVALVGCGGSKAPTVAATDPVSHLAWVDESSLDAPEQHTLAEIRKGPPYDYPRNDGVTYHNNNRVLPREADGWYREFTVVTPGESDRGPRRMVTGRDGAVYLTVDHYDTFRRIRETA